MAQDPQSHSARLFPLGLFLFAVVMAAVVAGFFATAWLVVSTSKLGELESFSGIQLPSDAKALEFQYLPPIDPIYFAKLEVPAGTRTSLVAQFEDLEPYDVPDDFANDQCDWWPTRIDKTVYEKRAVKSSAKGSVYIDARLIEEGGKLVLYLKCFTI